MARSVPIPMSSHDNDMIEYAWAIIANVSGGDWSKQSKEWIKAARKWREEAFSKSRIGSISDFIKTESRKK